jgi:hypothetical protein
MRFPLGEMTVGDILDRGIKILFSRLPLFYIINLIVLSPVIAFQVVEPFFEKREIVIGKAGFDVTTLFSGAAVGLAAIFLLLILEPIGRAAILRVIMQTYVGKPAGFGEAFAFALSRFVPLLLASFLVGLIVFAGFIMCIVPGIIAAIGLAFVAQVVVLERLGPAEGLRRSWSLTQGYRGRVFGVLLLIGVAGTVVQGVLGVGLNLVLPAQETVRGNDVLRFIRHPENQAITAAITYLVSILFTTYQAVCTTLLYLDLRIRKEGFDLELAAQLGEETRSPKEGSHDRSDENDDDRLRTHRDEPEDSEEGLDPDRPFR